MLLSLSRRRRRPHRQELGYRTHSTSFQCTTYRYLSVRKGRQFFFPNNKVTTETRDPTPVCLHPQRTPAHPYLTVGYATLPYVCEAAPLSPWPKYLALAPFPLAAPIQKVTNQRYPALRIRTTYVLRTPTLPYPILSRHGRTRHQRRDRLREGKNRQHILLQQRPHYLTCSPCHDIRPNRGIPAHTEPPVSIPPPPATVS
ncbi:uncharacterized protein BDZ83DRAFT_15773 [Colletotrichum acutatum]|uniref:Uncharacterized protein n=1 Tax=Glomerella acutata TaxID=27357 RepID=A0AAD8XLV7_GLOAC|nr:uncharacterized protein BDZ83DRAFT_15773 [Colletotrichum acutatum]KAK1729724.1 hypothetical protein BDZ83DRAFT_15773 [Colletotrichum acutatum]